jgi:hypothetical protein
MNELKFNHIGKAKKKKKKMHKFNEIIIKIT